MSSQYVDWQTAADMMPDIYSPIHTWRQFLDVLRYHVANAASDEELITDLMREKDLLKEQLRVAELRLAYGDKRHRDKVLATLYGDKAVEVFGEAWRETPAGAPGARRRAGLRAVAKLIGEGDA